MIWMATFLNFLRKTPPFCLDGSGWGVGPAFCDMSFSSTIDSPHALMVTVVSIVAPTATKGYVSHGMRSVSRGQSHYNWHDLR